jgi:hypothetical protein
MVGAGVFGPLIVAEVACLCVVAAAVIALAGSALLAQSESDG